MPDNSELVNALSGGGLLSSIANPRVLNPNLLGDSLGRGSEIANSMWRNKLAQSQQAAGDAFRASLDPDGTPNQPLLNQKLAADPNASLSALSTSQAGQTLDNTTFTTQMQRVGMMANANLELLMRFGGKPPLDEIKKNIENHAKQFGFTPDQVSQAEGMFSDDAVKNGQVMLENSTAGLSHLSALSRVTPGSGIASTPQGDVPYQTAPAGAPGGPGAITVQPGAITHGMSETDLNSPMDTVDPNRFMPDGKTPNPGYGQKQVITKREMLTRMGIPIPGIAQPGKPNAYNGKGNPMLGDLPNPPTDNNGQPIATPPPTPAIAPTPAAPAVAPAPAARTPVVTSLSPSQTTEQTATATQGTEEFKKISDQSVAARSRGAALDNMLADTSQFTSGPGTDVIARVRAIANRLGLNVNTEGLSAVESFRKLAAALNANQGSDARLSVSEASNPHADLSPAGVDLMLRQLRGNEDYTQARGKLAAAHPNKTDIAGFEDKTGSQLDPRTFQYDRMTGPQKETYFKSLPDKAKFVKAHDAAAALLPGGQ